MDITHLTPDQYVRQAWKNGGGTTTELARQEADGRVLWRLSIAAVEQSGPFSDFSGFDRTIMLLKGNGMVLSFDGAAEQRIDRPRLPFAFPGDWKTQCRLIDGPVEDFNFMFDRQRASGQLWVHELTDSGLSNTLLGDTEVLHCLQGRAEVAAGGRRILLETASTLRFERCAGEPVAIAALDLPCSLAVVRIECVLVDTKRS